jgi:hypothetical protein
MAYAEAGVVITSVDTSYEDPGDSGTSTSYIGDNDMRAETRTKNENNIIIFRSDREVIWAIDPADNSYTEMTKQDLKKMKGQIDEAMRRMQEEMKNLPPEQRAMIEQMMKSKAAPPEPESPVFKKVASGVKVGKWKCDTYEGYEGGELVEEVCTTDWKNLGIERKDFQVMQRMSEFMSELSPHSAGGLNVGSAEWEKEQGYPGIPVRTIEYSMGKKVFQTDLKDVKRQQIDSSLFELPKGLTKKSVTGPDH